MSEAPLLTRERAAQWLQGQGLARITARSLAEMATRSGGPTYAVIARVAYYREADLRAWLDSQFKAAEAPPPARALRRLSRRA